MVKHHAACMWLTSLLTKYNKTTFEWLSCCVRCVNDCRLCCLSELLRDQVQEASCTTRTSSVNTKTVETSQTKLHRSTSSSHLYILFIVILFTPFRASFSSYSSSSSFTLFIIISLSSCSSSSSSNSCLSYLPTFLICFGFSDDKSRR